MRAVETYPRGYVFADEVGLGKTIEAGLVLRELLLSGKAEKALLLVPASVTEAVAGGIARENQPRRPRYTATVRGPARQRGRMCPT